MVFMLFNFILGCYYKNLGTKICVFFEILTI